MGFNVKAYVCDPALAATALDLEKMTRSDLCKEEVNRNIARTQARFVLRSGYWLEIFDSETGELLSGPHNPNGLFPTYII